MRIEESSYFSDVGSSYCSSCRPKIVDRRSGSALPSIITISLGLTDLAPTALRDSTDARFTPPLTTKYGARTERMIEERRMNENKPRQKKDPPHPSPYVTPVAHASHPPTFVCGQRPQAAISPVFDGAAWSMTRMASRVYAPVRAWMGPCPLD